MEKISEKKFDPTDLERLEREFNALPPRSDDAGELERKEFDVAVKNMKNGKERGNDGITSLNRIINYPDKHMINGDNS